MLDRAVAGTDWRVEFGICRHIVGARLLCFIMAGWWVSLLRSDGGATVSRKDAVRLASSWLLVGCGSRHPDVSRSNLRPWRGKRT